MKCPVLMCLLIPAALAYNSPPARAESSRADNIQIAGKHYTPLPTYARANDFTVRWFDRDKVVDLSNRTAHLQFNVDPRQDARKARINGTDVWLAFPVAPHNGTPCISQTDIDVTLGPVLAPPRNAADAPIRTVFIDPGHGGKDPGYQVGSRDEKKFTLLLGQEVRSQLTRAGFKVVMSRTTDSYSTPGARPELARKHAVDLFISLHFNSAGPQHNEVKGIEVYCLTPAGAFSTNAGGEGDTRGCPGNRNNEKNMLLAYQMQSSLIHALGSEDRGVHRARFEVLTDATMPAILIEGGFMSNPDEGHKIFDTTYRRQMAKAIVDGIVAYKKIVKG